MVERAREVVMKKSAAVAGVPLGVERQGGHTPADAHLDAVPVAEADAAVGSR